MGKSDGKEQTKQMPFRSRRVLLLACHWLPAHVALERLGSVKAARLQLRANAGSFA